MSAPAKRARTAQERMTRLAMLVASPEFPGAVLAAFLLLMIVIDLTGCVTEPVKPIVQTVVVEKPVQVRCQVPPIERPAWETERTNPADAVLVSRSIRAELEERRGYEARLEAAAKSCE